MRLRSIFLCGLGVASCVPADKGDCDTGDSVGYDDADDDGIAACEGDCNDDDAAVNPGATEICDGKDNDCDGSVDDDAVDARTWYVDNDGDGYGDATNTTTACDRPDGYILPSDEDCDDADPNTYPYADEICDDVDNDCDGEVDEDNDGDGYTICDGDCDDDIWDDSSWNPNAEDVHPDADEICDDADNDCDGEIDEDDAVDARTWYVDNDGDGYGDESATTEACSQPDGYAYYDGDCDDSSVAYNPGATEDDCADPHDYNCDGSTGYADYDGDGFVACKDCDDRNPGAWLGVDCP